MSTELFEILPNKDYEEDYYNPDITLDAEREEALSKYDASEIRYKAENPSSEEDVDAVTLGLMFGDNWDGNYCDVTPIVSKAAEELAWQMTMYGSMSEWLDAQKDGIAEGAYVNSGLYQINQAMENTKYHYEAIASTISNFKSFNALGSSSSILADTDAILANMESSASALLNIQNTVTDVISYIQGGNVMNGEVSDVINQQSDYVMALMGQQDLGSLLSTFPHSVADKFMNCDYTLNLFTLPQQLYTKLTSVVSILSSVRAPTNLLGVLDTVGTLREAVAEMQDAANIIAQGRDALSALKSNIENGNYIGVFHQAQNACKFVEKTSQFAAQYPYNQAYETEGGHIFETDNTPGHERLHIQHCTGTDVEIAPNGDMVSKIKNDCQFIIEKDFQNHVKGNQLLLVDDTSEVESKTMKLTATEDLNISAKKTTYTTDKLNIFADDTLLTNSKTLTIATDSSSSMSSVGPMYLTSDSQIVIDAPSILIGTNRTQLVNIMSSSTVIKSGTVFVSDGLIKMNGFITLN